MSIFEAKRQARIDRLRARAAKLRAFAKGKDFSLFSESRSGIPLGQPILVGHHSERRHRRHLERLNRLVEKGYDALKRAEELEQRAAAAEGNSIIQCDDPEAGRKIADMIKDLEAKREQLKLLNSLTRRSQRRVNALAELLFEHPDVPALNKADALSMATKLLTPDFAGRVGIPSYVLVNLGANIRRLKQRQEQLPKIQEGFESFTVGDIKVEYVDGQIQIEFPWKPDEPTRTRLKQLAFKWSRYSSRWVRKHTATTAGTYFKMELLAALREAKHV